MEACIQCLKSAVFSLKTVGPDTFRMRCAGIPSLKGIMYLGLPIDDKVYIEDFFSNKLSRAEKALYSLKSLG